MPEAQKAAPEVTEAPKATKVEDPTVFINSGLYNPKAEHTVKSWLEVADLLPCTYGELEKAGKDHKNKGFLPYLKQRKAIVPEGTDLSTLKPARKAKAKAEEPETVADVNKEAPKPKRGKK